MAHQVRRNWPRARGQGAVWFAFVVMVLELMIGVLADGGLLFATHRRAALLADSAASAGAGVLAALRADPASPPRLDPARAKAAAMAYVTRHQADAVPQVEVTPNHIVVRVTLNVPMVVVHAFGQDSRGVVAESEAHPMSGLAAPSP